MKVLMFSITMMLFTSCSQKEIMLQVCETGEKVLMYNDIYHPGDTVILEQTVDPIGELCFEIDNNWVKFDESHMYLGDNGYYKAVVIN